MNEERLGLPGPDLRMAPQVPRALRRTIYPLANFSWGGLELIPGIAVSAPEGGEELHVLSFEADGEQLAFLFTEEGRRALIDKLTGGIIPGIVMPPGSENGG